MPVTLTLHTPRAIWRRGMMLSLRVATLRGRRLAAPLGAVVDTLAKTVSGVTTHLSPYAIVTEAAGKTCAPVEAITNMHRSAERRHRHAKRRHERDGWHQRQLRGGVRDADLRRRDERVRAVSGRRDGQLRRRAEGVQRLLLLRTDGADLLRDRGGRGLRDFHGGRVDLPSAADLRIGRLGVRGLSRRDAAELHRQRQRLRGRVLLPTGGADLRRHDRGTCLRHLDGRQRRLLDAAASVQRRASLCRYFGATAQSCTDTTNGFTATCCFAVGTLPAVVGGGSSGGVDGGTPTSDAGSSGGPDAGTTGAGGNGDDGWGGLCAPGRGVQSGGIGAATARRRAARSARARRTVT